jgi:phage tail-like protein
MIALWAVILVFAPPPLPIPYPVGNSSPSPTPTARPYVVSRFTFELDGHDVPAVQSINGIQDVITEVQVGRDWQPAYKHKLTGIHKYANLTLKRGMTSDTSLWDWYNQTRQSSGGGRHPCAIKTTTSMGKLVEYKLGLCWPTKYSVTLIQRPGAVLHSNESIEIAHDGFQLLIQGVDPSAR